jgi:hypothetical protein
MDVAFWVAVLCWFGVGTAGCRLPDVSCIWPRVWDMCVREDYRDPREGNGKILRMQAAKRESVLTPVQM